MPDVDPDDTAPGVHGSMTAGFDLDDDGAPEAVALDLDADGTPDTVAFDLDDDGVVDAVAVVPAGESGFDLDDGAAADPYRDTAAAPGDDSWAAALSYADATEADPWAAAMAGDTEGAHDESMVTVPDEVTPADEAEATEDFTVQSDIDAGMQHMYDAIYD